MSNIDISTSRNYLYTLLAGFVLLFAVSCEDKNDDDEGHTDADGFVLEKVLLLNDGKDLKLGKPYVKDAKVEIKVLEHRRGPKIIVYKMRPKKKTRRKNGHRQELTRVLVQSISLGSKPKETKDAKTTASKVESE